MCRDGHSRCGLYMSVTTLVDMISTEKEIDVFYVAQKMLGSRPEFFHKIVSLFRLFSGSNYS